MCSTEHIKRDEFERVQLQCLTEYKLDKHPAETTNRDIMR